jgi:predicted nucleic acid-binding protein
MTVFADTSAIYAVLDQSDAHHGKAVTVWTRLLTDSDILVTSNYVLLETSALVQQHLGMPALRALHEDLSPLLAIEWISEDTHKAAVEATLTASRKKLSVVDCASFHLMRAAGIRAAFCFDHHFREQGFELLP